MRRFPALLVAAVAALSPVPAASAHEPPPSDEAPESCPPPDVVARYHPDRYSVYVMLPATGCPAREGREFSLSGWLDRTAGQTTEGYGQVTGCGPFEPSDADPDGPGDANGCVLEMSLDHPSPEAAYYDLSVTYPGADGKETVESHSFCQTGPDGAFCTKAER